jgi:hypothetical protein
MDFLNKIQKTVKVWMPDERQENMDKGHEFESYVANLFKLKSDYFAITNWSTDHSDKRSGIKVESDSNPDFLIRYKPTMNTLLLNVNGEHICIIIRKFEIMS